MEVDVLHRLSGQFADVCHDAIAVRKVHFLRQFGDHGINVADQRRIFLRHLRRGGEMCLRHDKEMHRRQRRNVLEREAFVVLIDLLARDLSRNDL